MHAPDRPPALRAPSRTRLGERSTLSVFGFLASSIRRSTRVRFHTINGPVEGTRPALLGRHMDVHAPRMVVVTKAVEATEPLGERTDTARLGDHVFPSRCQHPPQVFVWPTTIKCLPRGLPGSRFAAMPSTGSSIRLRTCSASRFACSTREKYRVGDRARERLAKTRENLSRGVRRVGEDEA